MIFLLIALTLYVVGGVTVFRRTGHAAIESAAKVTKARREVRDIMSPLHSTSCNNNPRWPSLARSPDYPCECSLANDASPMLPWVFIWTTLFWPIVVSVWGIDNSLRLYKRLRGEDYNFFVAAPKVKTQAELLAESETRRKELEIKIAELEQENLK